MWQWHSVPLPLKKQKKQLNERFQVKKTNLAMVLVSFCCLAQKAAIYLEAVCSKFHATGSKRNWAMVAVAFHEIKTAQSTWLQCAAMAMVVMACCLTTKTTNTINWPPQPTASGCKKD